MILLLLSYVCDYCDGLTAVEWQRGFVVFRGDDDFARPVYVFPTQTDAALYRNWIGLQDFPIRECHFVQPVLWRRGSSQFADIRYASKTFTLHRDHRFEAQPYHGFLA